MVRGPPRGASYHGPPPMGGFVHHYEPRDFSPARRQLFREEAKMGDRRSYAESPPARNMDPSASQSKQ